MMTFGGRRAFHARVDLPGEDLLDARTAEQLAASLIVPALRHGVRGVVLLIHTDRSEVADVVWAALDAATQAAGVEAITALHADGTRWRRLDLVPETTSTYDVSAHPFVVQAMVDGRLGYRSRAEMAASLEADPPSVAEVSAAIGGLGRSVPPGRGAAAVSRIRELAASGRVPDATEWAGLLLALEERDAWDDLCALSVADGLLPERLRWFWAQLVPRTPDAFLPGVGAALGFAAWRAGDGAMAWIAVDLVRRAEPDHPTAAHLAGLLEDAVPPERVVDADVAGTRRRSA